jgi:hypothetical protein
MSALILNTTDGLVESVRQISPGEEEKLRLLCGGPPGLMGALKAKHHRVAQLAAGGMGIDEIAQTLALDRTTVQTLLRSTAMQELVEEYQKDDVKTLQKRTKMAAAAGINEVHRLLENPVGLDFKDIVSATQMLLDRSGVGPTSKQLIASATLTREELFGLTADDRVIDVEVVGGEKPIPLAAGKDESATSGAPIREEVYEVVEGRATRDEEKPLVH